MLLKDSIVNVVTFRERLGNERIYGGSLLVVSDWFKSHAMDYTGFTILCGVSFSRILLAVRNVYLGRTMYVKLFVQ